jgi:hypothetical protein
VKRSGYETGVRRKSSLPQGESRERGYKSLKNDRFLSYPLILSFSLREKGLAF